MHLSELGRVFAGERWSASPEAAERYGVAQVPLIADRIGLSDVPGSIFNGGNSGQHALGLAHQFGAARLILLGYDLQATGGASHWHGDHPPPLGNAGRLEVWAERMKEVARDALACALDIVNCSRATAITCFRREPLEEVLCAT